MIGGLPGRAPPGSNHPYLIKAKSIAVLSRGCNVDGESLARCWRGASTFEQFLPDCSVKFPIGEDFGRHNDIGATVGLVDDNVFDTHYIHSRKIFLGFVCSLFVCAGKPARLVNQRNREGIKLRRAPHGRHRMRFVMVVTKTTASSTAVQQANRKTKRPSSRNRIFTGGLQRLLQLSIK